MLVKLNFVNSSKKRTFALVNQQRGLPRESAFSLFRERETWTLSRRYKDGIRQMISRLYCIRIHTTYSKWSTSADLIFFVPKKGVQALRSG